MYHWPDGLFQKRFFEKNVNKISGRNLLTNIILPRIIKKIYVLGNASKKQIDYVYLRFKKPVEHIDLPYSNSVYDIFLSKNIPKHFQKTDLIILTLPTPKQEQLANLLSEGDHYKIICIGGSVAIWSGLEQKVPEKLINFEFLWRLRYETRRRLVRLLKTFCYILIDFIKHRKIIKPKLLVIN